MTILGGDDKIVATTESIVNGGIGLDGVIYLGAGNVTIDVAAASLERIQLADGNDVVDGSGVAEALTMLGRDGDDQLTGGAGKNRIMGGRGNDILKGGGENDFLFAGEGSNTISGGAGNDIINSALGSDAILAGSGDDRITANVRFTSLDGGVGFDRLTLIGSTGVTLDLSATHIEFVRGDLGDDTIDGSSQTTAVTIFGNDGNDTLTGSDFNDFLEGGHGNDYIKGGGGVDKASFQDSDAGVLVSLLLTGEQSTNDGNDTLVGIENLLGSSHSDTLIGDDGANVLDGGGGADLLIGGHGNDLYRVDILSDRINEQAGDGTDTVQSWTSYELPDNVERLVLEGSENYSGIGNSSSNFIRGNSGDNYLAGAAGNDGLNGGAGRDDLLGQAGNDRLVGEEGADHLEGGAGDDVLDGGNGDDRLEDGLGSDMLTGGAGADSFVFGERESPDVQDGIVDFSHAEGDKINLVSIDADTTASGDQAFNFIGTADFHGTAGELRYEQTATSTLLSGDTNGDGNADFTIALTGLHDLQGGDFVL